MQKSILITGAGSGFGKGTAIELAKKGHRVIATTETVEQADALRNEAPQLQVEKLDITSSDDIAKATKFEVDVLINNAGAGQTGNKRQPQRQRQFEQRRLLQAFKLSGQPYLQQSDRHRHRHAAVIQTGQQH